jgi:hypothetical protein
MTDIKKSAVGAATPATETENTTTVSIAKSNGKIKM